MGIVGRDLEGRIHQRQAVVLKVSRASARVLLLGEDGSITFGSRDLDEVVPGQLVTLRLERRWTWRGDEYANGRVEAARIEVEGIGLHALPLHGGELQDLRDGCEPFRAPDPYAPLWQKHTAAPRRCYEMDRVAWFDRAHEGGDRDALMDALCADLRCIDAHAHLGGLEFRGRPERALLHFMIGAKIGELSLPRGFDGVLQWGELYNRPYLRCLHGLGLCHWRLGELDAARRVFERMLALNPNDNQGARFCLLDVLRRERWTDSAMDAAVDWN